MRFNFYYEQTYDLSSRCELFTVVSRQQFFFFPHIGEVKQIHTHKVPSDKSLFLHKALPAKSTPPSSPLFHQEHATEKYQFSNCNGNVYVHFCVPPFHFSVSWSSEMQFGVIYLESGVARNSMLYSRYLNFVLVSLFLAEHT